MPLLVSNQAELHQISTTRRARLSSRCTWLASNILVNKVKICYTLCKLLFPRCHPSLSGGEIVLGTAGWSFLIRQIRVTAQG